MRSFRGISERTGWGGTRPYYRYKAIRTAMSGADERDSIHAVRNIYAYFWARVAEQMDRDIIANCWAKPPGFDPTDPRVLVQL